jgi:hypothetical protein
LKCADILGMKRFFERCTAVLEHYAPVYAPTILTQCEDSGLPDCDSILADIREMCVPEVVEFFQAFVESSEANSGTPPLLRLPLVLAKKILADDTLGVQNEDVVFEYAARYWQFVQYMRKAETPGAAAEPKKDLEDSLWECVRFPHVSDLALRHFCDASDKTDNSENALMARYILPEMHRRLRALHATIGDVGHAGTDVDSALPVEESREPTKRYRSPSTKRCFRIFFPMVVRHARAGSSDVVEELIVGALHKSLRNAKRLPFWQMTDLPRTFVDV